MTKVLITGATDGIGKEAAKVLAAEGHHILAHGRDATRLTDLEAELKAVPNAGPIQTLRADLSVVAEVRSLAKAVSRDHQALDVLINNAGVLRAPNNVTADGLDIRLAVNTVAPYILAKSLMPLLGVGSRVINISSAAQAPVEMDALIGQTPLDDMAAYSQSKLAIMMWTNHLAWTVKESGPIFVSVNPGSLLATKMVKEGFGIDGNDIGIGADILRRSAVSDEFIGQSGKYFDNDAGQFGAPHPDALDKEKCATLVLRIEEILKEL